MGTRWVQSGTVERDRNDDRAIGAQAYFYEGGTTAPLTVYEDADQSVEHDHPLTTDAYGRWPVVFIPYVTSFDVKVLDADDVQLYYHTEIPNPDPQDEAPEGVSPEQLYQTGDWAFSTVGGVRTGFVRAAGRTIGSAGSGATERADADTEDLFLLLWGAHDNTICAVSGGRGASASEDFAANKTLTLFDCRGGHPIGLDDMGNSAASRFGNTPFSTGTATTAGSICGLNDHTLTEAQLAAHVHAISLTSASNGAHTHTGTTNGGSAHTHSVTDPGHLHALQNNGTQGVLIQQGATADYDDIPGANQVAAGVPYATFYGNNNVTSATTGISLQNESSHTHAFTTASDGAHTHSVSGNSASTGSGSAHNNVSRAVLGTWYIKL